MRNVLFVLCMCACMNVFTGQVKALNQNDIQQQINSLPESGGTVTLEPGEYLLTEPNGSLEYFPNGNPINTAVLIRKNNVVLQGSPHGTVLKLAPHTKMRIISISGKNVTVRNMILDGNKANRNGTSPYPDGDVVDGLLFADGFSENIIWENMEIKNGIEDAMGCWKCNGIVGRNNYNHDNGTPQAPGAGFSISGATNGLAENNRIENNVATGIWSSFDASNVRIIGNTIRDNASGGITLGGGSAFNGLGGGNSGFEIRNNILSGNGSAAFATITIYASNNGLVENNVIESSYYDSFQIGGTAQYKSENWVISKNICASIPGINSMDNSVNLQLSNNACRSNIASDTRNLADIYGTSGLPDGVVNVYDFTPIVRDFGKVGQAGFSTADISGVNGFPDGSVDMYDYSMFVSNFGK